MDAEEELRVFDRLEAEVGQDVRRATVVPAGAM